MQGCNTSTTGADRFACENVTRVLSVRVSDFLKRKLNHGATSARCGIRSHLFGPCSRSGTHRHSYRGPSASSLAVSDRLAWREIVKNPS